MKKHYTSFSPSNKNLPLGSKESQSSNNNISQRQINAAEKKQNPS